MGLEGIDCEGVIRRHKYDHRHNICLYLANHLEPGHARHLHIEKHDIWLVFDDGGNCFAAVLADLHDGYLGKLLQAHGQPLPGQAFIIDDDRG